MSTAQTPDAPKIDAPVGVPVPPLELHEAPAALAFHCLNTAAMILRGDELDPDERARANELLAQGTVHVGALYLETIRHERDTAELKEAVVSLTRQLDDATALLRECASLSSEDATV